MDTEKVFEEVGFAGDWHGNRFWAVRMLKAFHDAGVTTIYHTGDFGLWPGAEGKNYLVKVHRALEEYDQSMFIVLGNHEDYDRVKVMQTDDEGWLFLKEYPRMRFAPRGHVWVTAGGVRMAALGGAASVDKGLRTQGKSWWPEEEILEADGGALIRNVQNAGWDRVDVIITHDAPAGLSRKGMSPKPSWLTPEIEHYAWTQRVRLREALDAVKPRWLVHGHWHEWFRDSWDGVSPDYTEYTCEVVGLPCDDMVKNLIIAELIPGVGLGTINPWVGGGWAKH